jgi:hypothetical protein
MPNTESNEILSGGAWQGPPDEYDLMPAEEFISGVKQKSREEDAITPRGVKIGPLRLMATA